MTREELVAALNENLVGISERLVQVMNITAMLQKMDAPEPPMCECGFPAVKSLDYMFCSESCARLVK